jgi:hypothetical protein
MVDDKLRVLAAMKQSWQDQLTTIFPRQGITRVIRKSWQRIRRPILLLNASAHWSITIYRH